MAAVVVEEGKIRARQEGRGGTGGKVMSKTYMTDPQE